MFIYVSKLYNKFCWHVFDLFVIPKQLIIFHFGSNIMFSASTTTVCGILKPVKLILTVY